MKDNIYTIPAHLPFAETLAQWIIERHGREPLGLSRMLLFLPSRRACRAMREAFLRVREGKALLLPRLCPIGDADENLALSGVSGMEEANLSPPENFAFRRLFALATLIQQYRARISGRSERFDHALRLAEALAQLLDEIEREQASLANLHDMVPDEFAEHWELTLEFLQIISKHWPQITKEEGLISPLAHRNNVLTALAAQWRAEPPSYPVLAAGTTGSIPATAGLIETIAGLDQGTVILPGLDLSADADYFRHLEEHHPQWGLDQLLRTLKCQRSEIRVIGMSGDNARMQLLSQIMRPAAAPDRYRVQPEALSGLRRVTCATRQEEATAIALMLRETLQSPGRTAAVVTHDRDLARAVAAQMERFGVSVDDSAGRPLAQMPLAVFLRLVLAAAAGRAASLPLFALLKHPLTHAGLSRKACLDATRVLEIRCMRGIFSDEGFAGMTALLRSEKALPPDVERLLSNLERMLTPLLACFQEGDPQSLGTLLEVHYTCAQALAGEEGWRGEEADSVEEFCAEMRMACARLDTAGAIAASQYPAIFETLLSGRVFRPEYGMHPRLKILSPVEARLQSFDRVILGGMNEGVWPSPLQADPWFNRSMRAKIGLPAPERRTGLAAHDFYSLASAPEVFLTRAEKSQSDPAIPSRWLVKLDALLAQSELNGQLDDWRWQAWSAALDSAVSVKPALPPSPRPPLAARPRELGVTQVPILLRDPYSIYVSVILRIRPLAPLGQEASGVDFGIAVHRALEHFVRVFPQHLPENGLQQLLHRGEQALRPLFFNAAVRALWWPRFERIAGFVLKEEEKRRPYVKKVWTEVEGACRFGDFLLKGRADRVEELADGTLCIIDYKTGKVPDKKEIEEGLASQLVLLALIAQDGAMAVRGASSALEYWQLRGDRIIGEIKAIAPMHINGYVEAAKRGVVELIDAYNRRGIPYYATPVPSRANRYNDYAHLARMKEWG